MGMSGRTSFSRAWNGDGAGQMRQQGLGQSEDSSSLLDNQFQSASNNILRSAFVPDRPAQHMGASSSLDMPNFKRGGLIKGPPPPPDGSDNIDIKAKAGEYALPTAVTAIPGAIEFLDSLVLMASGKPPVHGGIPTPAGPSAPPAPDTDKDGFAQGGLVGVANTLRNRGEAIDGAVDGAVNGAQATPPAPPESPTDAASDGPADPNAFDSKAFLSSIYDDKTKPGYAQGGVVTKLDGSTVPISDYNQDTRARSLFGRDRVASDPTISDQTMAAIPPPDTRMASANIPRPGFRSNMPMSPDTVRQMQGPQLNTAKLDADLGPGGQLRHQAVAENVTGSSRYSGMSPMDVMRSMRRDEINKMDANQPAPGEGYPKTAQASAWSMFPATATASREARQEFDAAPTIGTKFNKVVTGLAKTGAAIGQDVLAPLGTSMWNAGKEVVTGTPTQPIAKPAAPQSATSATGAYGPQTEQDAMQGANTGGNNIARMAGTNVTPVYKNTLANPADQAEFGKAIYSGTLQGATKGGFNKDFAQTGNVVGVPGQTPVSLGNTLPSKPADMAAIGQATQSGRDASRAALEAKTKSDIMKSWQGKSLASAPDQVRDIFNMPRQGENLTAMEQRLSAPQAADLAFQRQAALKAIENQPKPDKPQPISKTVDEMMGKDADPESKVAITSMASKYAPYFAQRGMNGDQVASYMASRWLGYGDGSNLLSKDDINNAKTPADLQAAKMRAKMSALDRELAPMFAR